MSGTANEEYFQASVRHAVEVRRCTQGVVVEILKLLDASDKDVTAKLRARLGELGLTGARSDYKAKRLRSILTEITLLRTEAFRAINDQTLPEMEDYGRLEGRVEEGLLEASIPIEFILHSVSADKLAAIVTNSPFEGQILGKWFSQLEAQDADRIRKAITLGYANGETIDEIVRRVVGTRANNYQDGAMAISRRNAESIVRTSINHISNAAREQVWNANSDILGGVRWVSVLDGRTTPVCQGRDGQIYPLDSGPRPPAHFNCRSIVVAVIDGVALVGNRPYVTDTRTRKKREVDFRRMAKEQKKTIQEVRSAWAEANIGTTPSATTYNDWLKKQSPTFQDKVLGPKRGDLFRQGNLPVQAFTDRAGNQITLDRLKDMYPDAWARAF